MKNLSAAIGLGATLLFFTVALWKYPSDNRADVLFFQQAAREQFQYGDGLFDLSVMSPVRGLAGLSSPPFCVWLNPVLLASHCWPDKPAGTLVAAAMLLIATFALSLSFGLGATTACVTAQLLCLFVFPPHHNALATGSNINLADLLYPLPSAVVPLALATGWLAAFQFSDRDRWRWVCPVICPLLLLWSVLADPLYTAVIWMPLAVVAPCLLLAGRGQVFWRRFYTAMATLLAVVAFDLPRFYYALTHYCARARFPNEQFVEVQRWDNLTTLMFQGGAATALCVLLVGVSGMALLRGHNIGLMFSVLAAQIIAAMTSLVYVYSGTRWSAPLPVYCEIGLLPVYLVGMVSAVKSFRP